MSSSTSVKSKESASERKLRKEAKKAEKEKRRQERKAKREARQELKKKQQKPAPNHTEESFSEADESTSVTKTPIIVIPPIIAPHRRPNIRPSRNNLTHDRIPTETIRSHCRAAWQHKFTKEKMTPHNIKLPDGIPPKMLDRIIAEERQKLRREAKEKTYLRRIRVQTEFRLNVLQYTRDWNINHALAKKFNGKFIAELDGWVLGFENVKVWTQKFEVNYATGLSSVWAECDVIVFRPVIGSVSLGIYNEEKYPNRDGVPSILLDWNQMTRVVVQLSATDQIWIREQELEHACGVWFKVEKITTPVLGSLNVRVFGTLMRDRPLEKSLDIGHLYPRKDTEGAEGEGEYIKQDDLYDFSESSDDESDSDDEKANTRKRNPTAEEEGPEEIASDDDNVPTVNPSKERRFYPDNDNDDTDAVDTRPEGDDDSSRSSDLSEESAADPKELADETLDMVQQGPILASDDESVTGSDSDESDSSSSDDSLSLSSSSSEDEKPVKKSKSAKRASSVKVSKAESTSDSKKRKRKESSTSENKKRKKTVKK
eukprot:CAMPEP_0117446060 /NCGR_PEP_ID=MMETSP0759-20121206/6131_1 /TAXON_ID=63605 /ORGANISM="Percolomonas cosmopolitus, Strain WS" /LENGTH=541 /DNA_ID=CAMNT_0005238285 /DNA_START=84 /DNA_END=1710 /DNA_ORIENTATION=+